MTREQRKTELINWIAELENESLLQLMEELRVDSSKEIPDEIIALLETSNQASKKDLTVHTSTRDILNK